MRQNCLTRALDQWNENKELFRLWYNSNHVIALETFYSGYDLTDCMEPPLKYLPLQEYGYDYFTNSFGLTDKYKILLKQYLEVESKITNISKDGKIYYLCNAIQLTMKTKASAFITASYIPCYWIAFDIGRGDSL